MPQSPRAHLGTGIHSLFERAATDASFPTDATEMALDWDKMVAQAEHKLSSIPYMHAALPFSRSIPNIGLLRSRTLISLAEVRAVAAPPPVARGSTQAQNHPGKLSNKAATVVGVPDRISRTLDGVVISDFKTGTFLQADGTVTPDYQVQLQLYGALFHENYGEWPTRLEIVSINGSRIPVPVVPNQCEDLLTEAHNLCVKARKKTPTLVAHPGNQAEAAAPNAETCRFCPFRPRCPAYLASALSAAPLCQADVAGSLLRWSRSGNGAIFVEIQRTTGTLGVRSISPDAPAIAALSSSRPGDKILVVNLRQDTSSLLTATNYTAVHTYPAT